MKAFARTAEQIWQLLESGELVEAEQRVDHLAESDLDQLDLQWEMGNGAARYLLSSFYNNIGAKYQVEATHVQQQGDEAGMMEAARCAERCHEKALDMYNMSAKDFLYLPSESPLNKNVIFMFWGLGSTKFVLGKKEESRQYLELCLRFSPDDEQSVGWQSEVSTYLRLLDGKSFEIVLRVTAAMPNFFDPHILRVQGELLEWESYTKPRRKEYGVYLTDDLIEELEAKGFHDPSTFEGAILVLESHESGDLRRPLNLVQLL